MTQASRPQGPLPVFQAEVVPGQGWGTQEGSQSKSEKRTVQASAGAGLLHRSVDQSHWGALSQSGPPSAPPTANPETECVFKVTQHGPRSSGQVTASLVVSPFGLQTPHSTTAVTVTQLLFLTSGHIKLSLSFKSECEQALDCLWTAVLW